MTAPASSSLEKATLCAQLALDRKAENLTVLEVRELTSAANYFVIASGRSDTQVQAIARSIEDGLRQAGHRPLAVEGIERGHWVLIDAADVIVHVFYEPIRAFYDLEGLWRKAPRIEVEGATAAGSSAPEEQERMP